MFLVVCGNTTSINTCRTNTKFDDNLYFVVNGGRGGPYLIILDVV